MKFATNLAFRRRTAWLHSNQGDLTTHDATRREEGRGPEHPSPFVMAKNTTHTRRRVRLLSQMLRVLWCQS